MASTLDGRKMNHPNPTERPRTLFLPHRLIGWVAVAWLAGTWGFLACWGKLNDVLTGSALLGTAAALVVVAVVLSWQALRRDRSLLLGAMSVLSGVVAVFVLLVVLAFAAGGG
jgi:small-conductance mechanosensitive channel